MSWKEETTMSQKETFIKTALDEEHSFSWCCNHYNITRKTGYKWLKRYRQYGSDGLSERSRRPKVNPNRSIRDTEEKIIGVRERHPAWGARKIKAYLLRKGIKNLPAVSTITQIIKRYGYISKEASLKRLAFTRFEHAEPNELWQMDFKGKFQLETNETCYPLTILDDHSRFSICLSACSNERYTTVRDQLEKVFKQYGLPKCINVDNGNPWGDAGRQPHTKLTVWLMRLGIRVSHSRPKHPQTNGKDERFHRTLKEELLAQFKNTKIKDFSTAQMLFDEWRDVYNHERPHEALNLDVPVNYYRFSKIEMPDELPAIEYSDDAITRTVRGNGYIRYKNREYHIGEAFCGHYIEVKLSDLEDKIELYFGQNKIYTHKLNKN